jgi:hypothetical protein
LNMYSEVVALYEGSPNLSRCFEKRSWVHQYSWRGNWRHTFQGRLLRGIFHPITIIYTSIFLNCWIISGQTDACDCSIRQAISPFICHSERSYCRWPWL